MLPDLPLPHTRSVNYRGSLIYNKNEEGLVMNEAFSMFSDFVYYCERKWKVKIRKTFD